MRILKNLRQISSKEAKYILIGSIILGVISIALLIIGIAILVKPTDTLNKTYVEYFNNKLDDNAKFIDSLNKLEYTELAKVTLIEERIDSLKSVIVAKNTRIDRLNYKITLQDAAYKKTTHYFDTLSRAGYESEFTELYNTYKYK